jgi:hypothetical protein
MQVWMPNAAVTYIFDIKTRKQSAARIQALFRDQCAVWLEAGRREFPLQQAAEPEPARDN